MGTCAQTQLAFGAESTPLPYFALRGGYSATFGRDTDRALGLITALRAFGWAASPFEGLPEPVEFVNASDNAGLFDRLPDAARDAENAAAFPSPRITDKEWSGVYCGIADPVHLVFREPTQWAAFWKKAMAPYATSPPSSPLPGPSVRLFFSSNPPSTAKSFF